MYRIPGWSYAKLSEVSVDWLFGQTPSDRVAWTTDRNEAIPWVRVEDMQGRLLTQTKECVRKHAGKNLRTIEKDAVLVSTAGTIGKVAVAGMRVTCNQAVQGILFDSRRILPEFAYYYLKFYAPQLRRLANEVSVPNLPKHILENFLIGYPPLDEQGRIVSLLKKAERAVEIKRQERSLAENYLYADFSRTLGGADVRRRSAALSELLLEKPHRGIRRAAAAGPTGCVLVNSGGTNRFLYRDSSLCPPVEAGDGLRQRHRLQQGDLFVYPAAEGRAKLFLVQEKPAGVWLLGANYMLLRPDQEKILPEYLYVCLYLALKLQKKDCRMDEAFFSQLRIPLPDKERQGKVRRSFYQFVRLMDSVSAMEELSERLFQVLLQRSFLRIGLDGERAGDTDLREIESYIVWEEQGTKADVGRLQSLPEEIKEFLQQLSPFQQELLKELLKEEKPQAAHDLFKRARRKGRMAALAKNYSIQDVLALMKLLEEFGILEERQEEIHSPEEPETALLDHNNHPVTIRVYRLSEELGGEDAYET